MCREKGASRDTQAARLALAFFVIMPLQQSVLQAQLPSPQQTLTSMSLICIATPTTQRCAGRSSRLSRHESDAGDSEEARRHYVVGKTLFEGAKKPEDFNDAIAEYRAPCWPLPGGPRRI